MSVLLLGGTAEARALAQVLADEGTDVTSSLAGRVRRPRLPVGETRVGGFGGVEGLVGYLASEGVTAVVDATHPFATTISAHAAVACRRTQVPLLRVARPGWSREPGAGRWHWVKDHQEAAETAARLGSRVLLTTGRQSLPRFTGALASHRVVVRVVDPVDSADSVLPAGWVVVLDRGPYTLDRERALLAEHAVEVLVTKDSGGSHTRAKLDAADELGVEVVVVRRPEQGDGVPTVSDVDAVVQWLRSLPG